MLRIRYWVWINPEFGEYRVTDPMRFDIAEKVFRHFQEAYEQVELIEDDKEEKDEDDN